MKNTDFGVWLSITLAAVISPRRTLDTAAGSSVTATLDTVLAQAVVMQYWPRQQ